MEASVKTQEVIDFYGSTRPRLRRLQSIQRLSRSGGNIRPCCAKINPEYHPRYIEGRITGFQCVVCGVVPNIALASGGAGRAGRRPADVSVLLDYWPPHARYITWHIDSLVNPNAGCPICGASVLYYCIEIGSVARSQATI